MQLFNLRQEGGGALVNTATQFQPAKVDTQHHSRTEGVLTTEAQVRMGGLITCDTSI
jgi:hypothetical protein